MLDPHRGADIGDTSGFLSEAIVSVFRDADPFPYSGLNGRPLDPELTDAKALKKTEKELKSLARSAPGLAKKRAAGMEKDVAAAAEALERTLSIDHDGQLAEPEGEGAPERPAILELHDNVQEAPLGGRWAAPFADPRARGDGADRRPPPGQARERH